jgi:ubiquinone/menaquinone biosynthesis C-methylase UbiE
MSQREQWHFDENPDELYERFLVPSKFGPWAAELVALGAPQPGERVLDVACGTGVVTRLVLPHVGDTGKVVGLDLSAGRLAVARSLTSDSGMTIEWREGDVGALPFSDANFDLVSCQQGFQFFPDRLVALREMSRVLVSGGRLALSVWRSIDHQPGALAMANALQRHVSAEAAAFRHTPFALGEAEAIEAPMREAGFRDVVIRPTVKTVRFPSADAFTMRYICGVAPLARMVSEVDDNARSALLQDVSAALQSYVDADGLAIPTASHLVTAHT